MTAATLATAAFFLWREGSEHWASALPGHALGAVGIGLMLWAGFGYSFRKRRSGPGAPAMRLAMQSHVIAGLVGPYLVILHSGLAFRGLAGVLTLLTVLVVASGFVGRAVFAALPRDVAAADPVRAAMLDAEMARVETAMADLVRSGSADVAREDALRAEFASFRHQQELLRTQWRASGAGVAGRKVLSVWWLLHVPLSLALWLLAAAHVAGSLYFATLSR